MVEVSREALKKNSLFRGLNEEELAQVAKLCAVRTYAVDELCQSEGQPADQVNFITKGRIGVEFHIPNIAYGSKKIILDTLGPGDIFGWSALIKGTPWSTLKAVEPTEVVYVGATELLNLCENNYRIGYLVMKNLSMVITSRLRRNRMATLNAIVAIKGGW